MTPMSWLRNSVLLTALCALSFSTGCGDSSEDLAGDDVFYVYVVHGYAGGGELSVYGDTGPLATGLKFGEIAGDPDDATGATPLRIDRRQFSGALQLFLSGSSEVAPLNLESYAFYPGETVTLFLTRPNSPTEFKLVVMRHNQIANATPSMRLGTDPAQRCVLQFNNGLSLANNYTESAYDVQLQFRPLAPPTDPADVNIANPGVNRLVYDSMRDASIETECGPLTPAQLSAAADSSFIQSAVTRRGAILNEVSGDGWYYIVRGDGGDVWYRNGQWLGINGGGSSITAWRSSREYQNCIAGAVQVPVITNPDGSISCDTDNFDMTTVDKVRLLECNNPISYPGIPIRSGGDAGETLFLDSGGAAQCNYTFRPRTRDVDLVFNQGNGGPDTLAVFNVSHDLNSWMHATMFGSPINPLLYQLNSKQRAQPLATIANPTTVMSTQSTTPAAAPVAPQ